MSDLMSTLISSLGPEISQQVQSQFKLPAETSEQVLPAVADMMKSGLQEKAASGDIGDLLGGLTSMLGGSDSSSGGAGDLLGAMFGSNTSGMADGLAKKLGIDSNIANGILQMVVPMVMSFFSKESGSGSSGGGLADLVSMFTDDKNKKSEDKGEDKGMDDMGKTISQAGDLLSKLGGLFGKK